MADTAVAAAERTLPHNLEAEQSVLGAILVHNDAFNEAVQVIDAQDFYRDAHRRIFNGMVDGERETEYIRNRDRVMEVEHLLNMNYSAMDEMLAQQNLEDEYGEGGLDE